MVWEWANSSCLPWKRTEVVCLQEQRPNWNKDGSVGQKQCTFCYVRPSTNPMQNSVEVIVPPCWLSIQVISSCFHLYFRSSNKPVCFCQVPIFNTCFSMLICIFISYHPYYSSYIFKFRNFCLRSINHVVL